MPKYRVDVILARTYGTVVIDADNIDAAKEAALDLEAEDFDSGVDYSIDVLDVYEED